MFLPYIIIPYTDTISMVFPILIFYLYIKIKEEKNENKRAFFTILEGMLTILGYHIKPTIVIVVIAICIVEILRCKKIKMIKIFLKKVQPFGVLKSIIYERKNNPINLTRRKKL